LLLFQLLIGICFLDAARFSAGGKSFGCGFSRAYYGVNLTSSNSFHLGDAYSESTMYAALYMSNGYARGYGFSTDYYGLYCSGGEFWGGAFSGWTSSNGDTGIYVGGGTVHLSGRIGTAQRAGKYGVYLSSGYCYVGTDRNLLSGRCAV